MKDKPMKDKPMEDKPMKDKPMKDKPMKDEPAKDGLAKDTAVDHSRTRRLRPSLKNFLAYFIWPALGVPLLLVSVKGLLWRAMPFWPWMLGIIVIGGLIPAYGWLKTFFRAYEVRPESVMAREGLVSRYSSEIRIVDVRLVNVRQGIVQRLLGIGDVGFASAAGEQEEVVFAGVRDPQGIKMLVQERMKVLRPEGEE